MANSKLSEAEFIRLYQEMGATELARAINISVRNVHARRLRIEAANQIVINSPPSRYKGNQDERKIGSYPRRIQEFMDNGKILVGSDAHIWPGDLEPGHKAFLEMAEKIKPDMIVLNGDILDGARLSRFPPLQWQHTPTLREELDAVEIFLDKLIKTNPNSKLYWVLGNHCSRFENKLSAQVPEMANVEGMRLVDHFPDWTFCFSLWVNDDLVIKHRFKGGVHATHNNTLYAGKSMVTGHLHSLKYTPFSDYNGTRYGVDTGTLSDPYGDHAAYTEDNPLNHRAGFALLTIKENKLLLPELILVDHDSYQFRGEIYPIDLQSK